MLKTPSPKTTIKTALSPVLRLVLKSVRIFKLFYYAIFGSLILKLLFLKTGFFVFVILKLVLKFYS
ncbi:hypothetical protein EC538_01215 [Helicobacter pylori]|nr:hypothetical protein EC538_01215 [Helicobacter pylori]